MRPHIGWRFGTLFASMLPLAMAVRKAPGLRQVEVIRLQLGDPPTEIDPYLPLILAAFALSAMGTLVKKTRFILYGAIVSGVGWALLGATQLPLWLVGQRINLIAKPEPDVVFLGALTIAAMLLHLFIDALQEYHQESVKRGVPLNLVEWDQRRISITYAAAVGVVLVLGLVLAGLFQGPFERVDWVPQMTGAEWGTWILVLVALLFGGVLLVLGVHEQKPQKKEP